MSKSIAVGGLDEPDIVMRFAKKNQGTVKVSWRIVASHGWCCKKVGEVGPRHNELSIDNRDYDRLL
jgi:hypothetical protein